MPRARDAFQRAADLMPTFSAAFSNLGATLGELGEPAAALRAFRQALAHDPRSFTILNNIGVSSPRAGTARRLGGGVPPGHRDQPRRSSSATTTSGTRCSSPAGTPTRSPRYEEGQRRDPQQNRRQGCRLAVVRFANGDAAGAERDLWRFADAAPPDEREDLLLEAYEIAHALLTRHPALAPQRPFLDRIGAEIAKSE